MNNPTFTTRKQYRMEQEAQKKAARFGQIKQTFKKTVIISGMVLTIFTYVFANGSTLEVKASEHEVIEAVLLVQEGHTLSKIARDYGVSVEQIKQANNLTSDMIYVGQKLRLSSNSSTKEVVKPVQEVKEPIKKEVALKATGKATTYVVKEKDNLSKISKETGVSVEKIREYNDLVGDLIFAGETLQLTSSQTVKKDVKEQVKPDVKKQQVAVIYEGLATFNGAADNNTIEVNVGKETISLFVGYGKAETFNKLIGKQKTIQWKELSNGQQLLLSVK